MAVPQVTITWQSRAAKTIKVAGVVTGNPTSVTIELPASATPEGAVSRPQAQVVLNPVGEFEHSFTLCPFGNYDPPLVRASNTDGVGTATGLAMKLYAAGTMPVGTPRVLFPPLLIPAFNAPTVAIGAVVTDFTIVSTSPTDQTGVPFSFGQPFKESDLKPGDFLVGKIAGEADLPLQFNVKATHPNGSVRHAIISGYLPGLAAGTSKTIAMARSSTGVSTVPKPAASLVGGNFSLQLALNIAGVAWTSSGFNTIMADLPLSANLFGGDIVNSYFFKAPLKNPSGAEHPFLEVSYEVRRFVGAENRFDFDLIVEQSRSFVDASDIAYTGSFNVNFIKRMDIANAAGNGPLLHTPAANWKRSFWFNNDNPVHIKHNVAYLIATKQIPNYDPRVVVPEATLASYPPELSKPEFHMMGEGLFARDFSGTGGRADIGLAPGWYVAALLSQDKRAKDLMLKLADCSGGWPIHRRNELGGPSSGQITDVVHFPRVTQDGTNGDSKNADTGMYEKFGRITTTSQLAPDQSHPPAMAYIPYLLTGRHYYLDELNCWSMWAITSSTPGLSYRASEKGLVKHLQVRGQGWSFRGLAQSAAVTPDSHPKKQIFNYLVQTNSSWFNAEYTDNPGSNKLGIIVNGPAVIYGVNVDDDGIGTFQDDFVQQAFGHAAELGFKGAARFRNWKAKFHIGRMIAPGYCWTHAAPFKLAVRDGVGMPYFETLKECHDKSFDPVLVALPCNSPERIAHMNATRGLPSNPYVLNDMTGYAYGTTGYPSNFQPALAMSVDAGVVPDGDLAWDLFDSRAVQPKYGKSPQFAIVPRGIELGAPIDPSPDPDDPDPDEPIDPGPVNPDPEDPEDPPPPPAPPLPEDRCVGEPGQLIFIGRPVAI